MDEYITNKMRVAHIPGLAACVVKQAGIAWAQGYGWANIEHQIPMTPETVINIGSITKTVIATAIMQLWEQGKFALEDEINRYLPFPVRNPFHPDTAITFRHLLTHTPSIRDGAAYRTSYVRGDPTTPLGSWLQAYLTSGGALYNEQENFYKWRPGERFRYANVGFGVLGYLVEILSGTSLAKYCRAHIFEPLGMPKTSWYLADLNRTDHAVPYTYVSSGDIHEVPLQDPSWSRQGRDKEVYVPHCLYGFPNFPDGLLRTSVIELARFLGTYLNNGVYGDKSILQPGTIQEMLNEERAKTRQLDVPGVGSGIYGLGWYGRRLSSGDLVWGHAGADPGISTLMLAHFSKGIGTLVFANTGEEHGARLAITEYLFRQATEL